MIRARDRESIDRRAGDGDVIESQAIEWYSEVVVMIEANAKSGIVAQSIPCDCRIEEHDILAICCGDGLKLLHLVPKYPVLADRYSVEVRSVAERNGSGAV